MKLDSVLSIKYLNMVQFIYLIVLKTVVTLSRTLTFARNIANLKGQGNNTCKEGTLTVFQTVSMLGKKGKVTQS